MIKTTILSRNTPRGITGILIQHSIRLPRRPLTAVDLFPAKSRLTRQAETARRGRRSRLAHACPIKPSTSSHPLFNHTSPARAARNAPAILSLRLVVSSSHYYHHSLTQTLPSPISPTPFIRSLPLAVLPITASHKPPTRAEPPNRDRRAPTAIPSTHHPPTRPPPPFAQPCRNGCCHLFPPHLTLPALPGLALDSTPDRTT